jgi:hypothetical protein
MDITKFFHKLPLTPNVEVVIPLLPKRIRGPQRQPSRNPLLQGLHDLNQRADFRLTYQKVYVLGNDYVSVNA